MSAAVQAQPATTLATAAVRGTTLTRALHAEWTKLRTVSGPAWLLLGVAVLTIAVSTAAVGATHCPQSLTCPVDTTKLSLTGIQFGQAVVAILAVLAVSNEYSSGMMRVTLAAMPKRPAVLAAKAILLTGLVLVAGAVAVFGAHPGRAPDPARPRVYRRARLPPGVAELRADAARRVRLGPVPGADRAHEPWRRGNGAGLSRVHRRRPGAALRVPDHLGVHRERALAASAASGGRRRSRG